MMRASITATAAIAALLTVAAPPCFALTPEQIDELDGHIIVGNRKGGIVQIFNSSESLWRKPLWEYDTRRDRDGLTMTFDWINDVKRVRFNGTEHILIAGNGPGIALFNLETERFDFSYRPTVPLGESCQRKGLSIHAAEMLPDGNFAVADPTGSKRGGPSVRLIYGDNDDPRVLQSLSFAGAHAVVFDHKRQLLWARGGNALRKYKYVSAGRNSMLSQDGRTYRTPNWGAGGHDMMPMFREGEPDRLIFNCAEGLGVFHIENERFELLYGTIPEATNMIPDNDIVRQGKGVDHNAVTGEVIQNRYNLYYVNRPGRVVDGKMDSWSYRPSNGMEIYKAHWFSHGTFSYGPVEESTVFVDENPVKTGFSTPVNRAPRFESAVIRKPYATANRRYRRLFKGGAVDADGDKLTFEKVCGPEWATVEKSGLVTGKPRRKHIGESRMVIRVSDASGLSDVATFEFEVRAPPRGGSNIFIANILQ